jgi:hypothetical protein
MQMWRVARKTHWLTCSSVEPSVSELTCVGSLWQQRGAPGLMTLTFVRTPT